MNSNIEQISSDFQPVEIQQVLVTKSPKASELKIELLKTLNEDVTSTPYVTDSLITV